jgi:hypothetical protein
MHAPNGGHFPWSNTSRKEANVLKLLTCLLVHYFLPKLHLLVVEYNLIFTVNEIIESKINNEKAKNVQAFINVSRNL